MWVDSVIIAFIIANSYLDTNSVLGILIYNFINKLRYTNSVLAVNIPTGGPKRIG